MKLASPLRLKWYFANSESLMYATTNRANAVRPYKLSTFTDLRRLRLRHPDIDRIKPLRRYPLPSQECLP